MQQAYRILAATLGWFAVVLQYGLIVRYKTDGDLVAAAIRFLSYFTDLSNVLVALAMTLPWLAPDTALGRFFLKPSVRTAIRWPSCGTRKAGSSSPTLSSTWWRPCSTSSIGSCSCPRER